MGVFKNFIYTCIICVVFMSKNVHSETDNKTTNNKPVLKQEVVSIYNENFTDIPKDREPYYVKVQRCVIKKEKIPACSYCWPQPMTLTEVEIVVPDLKYYTKFYKYIVYNHTSCYWNDTLTGLNFNLHKTLSSNEINETEFTTKVNYNPPNVRTCNDYCKHPQPRFHLHSEYTKKCEYKNVDLNYLFIPFTLCLPGCKATEKPKIVTTELLDGSKPIEVIKEHKSCNLWNKEVQKSTSYRSRPSDPESRPLVLNNGLFVYITSPRMMLVAFILSTVLISILILDCNLCHCKKGMMYSIKSCGKNEECEDCVRRQQTMIEMV
ncbi:uncharacterized protein LOC124435552 isoform X1 [Xenia sp. Carnegie-2017]|uniref:uncharacterized protein LOC124435552 isoform X1 n=2 Tax=Xenia sp. Carnegie-2017 TaxID=2897299 RepID=UPI001F03D922|nr:uncharacterized protein LOC124435552 isoform X1 [Xenia sp. Carnegie-2017]